jgi:hypothetical protein
MVLGAFRESKGPLMTACFHMSFLGTSGHDTVRAGLAGTMRGQAGRESPSGKELLL